MIPGVSLVDFINFVGVLGILFVIFAESGLLIGFFLPGDSLLFTAGFLVNAGLLSINIHVFVFLLFVAATLGDNTGYLFGSRVGHKIFRRPNSLIFRQENIQKAADFYEKHGGKTIIIARFIPIVRTFAPVVAGIGKMNYRKFVVFNMIGAFLWAVGVTYLGYFAGKWFESIGIEIDQVLLPIIAIIILTSILPPLVHIFKDPAQRKSFVVTVKKQFATMFSRK